MSRRRPYATRARAVTTVGVAVLAAVVGAGMVGWFASGGPARQGYAVAACPPAGGTPELTYDAAFDARLRRTVLPVGPVPLAPRTATVCRYAPDGAVSGLELDPGRTAELTAAVAAPLDGYSSDALVAKRIPELTDAQLAANAAPPCTGRAPVTVIRFLYPDPARQAVFVEVRGGSCASLTNERLTIRTPPRVTAALDALPRL